MNILLFMPPSDTIGARLLWTIEGLAINEKIEIHRSIDSLSQRLRDLTYDIDVSILLTPSKKELSKILSICELLQDIKTILILPDRKKDTISRGHKLYPRYVSFADGDFKDIRAVLKKMTKNKQRVE